MSHEKAFTMQDPNYKEALSRYLNRIHHEDTLIDSRLNWFITSQTIFFTIYAVLLQWSSSTTGAAGAANPVFSLIPWVGLGACALNYSSTLAAVFAIYRFCRKLDAEFPSCSEHSQWNILGPLHTHILGQASPIFLPLVFLCVWLFALTRTLILSVVATLLCLTILAILWKRAFPYRISLRGRKGKKEKISTAAKDPRI